MEDSNFTDKTKEDLENELRTHMKEMEAKYRYQNVVPLIKKLGTEEVLVLLYQLLY